MHIDLEVTQDVAAPRERTWKRLLDPDFLAACAPGIEKVEPLLDKGENAFRVTVGTGVGPFRLRIRLDVLLQNLVAPQSTEFAVNGKAPGSEVKAAGSVRLEEIEQVEQNGAGPTRLSCAAAIEATGMVATMAGKNLPATARSIAGQFFRTFAERVAQEEAGPAR